MCYSKQECQANFIAIHPVVVATNLNSMMALNESQGMDICTKKSMTIPPIGFEIYFILDQTTDRQTDRHLHSLMLAYEHT